MILPKKNFVCNKKENNSHKINSYILFAYFIDKLLRRPYNQK